MYYSINNKDLIYKKSDTSQFFRAKVLVYYKAISEPDSKTIIDSGSVVIVDEIEAIKQKFFDGSINVNLPLQFEGYIETRVLDLNMKTSCEFLTRINIKNPFSQHTFLMKSLLNNEPKIIYSNYLPYDASISLYSSLIKSSAIKFNFYKVDFGPALPPFSSKEMKDLNLKIDSSFFVNRNDNLSYEIDVKSKGIYQMQPDSLHDNVFALFRFQNDFPRITDHQQMILATRYITNEEEYAKMSSSTDKKKAIDDFWVSIGGNPDRASGLIRAYYNRVQQANEYFSSYKEGWKTDMGMIYIVFGPAVKVYKNRDSELWVYGADNTPNSVSFRFNKVKNKYSDNDYVLERSLFLKDPWYYAVSEWRQGKVYLDE